VERLTAQPEPPMLRRLHHLVQQRHGIVDLLGDFRERLYCDRVRPLR
jgi:hypothetical protein